MSKQVFSGITGALADRLPGLAFLAFLLSLFTGGCKQNTFDLKVHLIASDKQPIVFRNSEVSVQFGKTPRLAPQPLTEDGRAVFSNLDRSLMDDTIRLTYLAKNRRPYRVVRQMFVTAHDRQDLDFTIEIIPDTTQMQFSLKDKYGLVTHATIRIDDNITVESDDYGFIQFHIAKPAGSTAHFVVQKNGKVLLDKDIVVSEDLQRLMVDTEQ